MYGYTVTVQASRRHPMDYPLRQNYRPRFQRAPAWLTRLWRWL